MNKPRAERVVARSEVKPRIPNMMVGIPNHAQRVSANIFGAGYTVNNGSETGHIAKYLSDNIILPNLHIHILTSIFSALGFFSWFRRR